MRAIDQWLESRRNRTAFKQLNSLDQRLLADIGIGESELNNLRRAQLSSSLMSMHLTTRLGPRLHRFCEILIAAAAVFVALGPRLDELGITYIIGLFG